MFTDPLHSSLAVSNPPIYVCVPNARCRCHLHFTPRNLEFQSAMALQEIASRSPNHSLHLEKWPQWKKSPRCALSGLGWQLRKTIKLSLLLCSTDEGSVSRINFCAGPPQHIMHSFEPLSR